MNDADLERVRADLAVVKGLCAEPAVQHEDVALYLSLAALGLVIAVTPWLLPIVWVKGTVVLFGAAWAVLYLPRKMRYLKQPSPERALEKREYWVWGVAAVALVSYVLYCRIVVPGGVAFDAQLWRRDIGAMFIFLGVGLAGNAMLHRTRRPLLAIAASFLTAGLLVPFASGATEMFAVLGSALAIGCLGTAAGIEFLARRERGAHGGD